MTLWLRTVISCAGILRYSTTTTGRKLCRRRSRARSSFFPTLQRRGPGLAGPLCSLPRCQMAIELRALAHVPLMQSLEHAGDAVTARRVLRAVDDDDVLPRTRERRKRVRVHIDHLGVAVMLRRCIHRHCQAEAQQSDLYRFRGHQSPPPESSATCSPVISYSATRT